MKQDHTKLYDVIIVGAGASGLAAAIQCSRRKLSCLVLDKNKKPGNKLYATGNGRCNVTNDHYSLECYYNNPFAGKILKQTDLKKFTIQYMKELGVMLTNKNGYYYPMSMQASTVVWAMLDALDPDYVEFIQETEVQKIQEIRIDSDSDKNSLQDHYPGYYRIQCQNRTTYLGTSVIISLGGCSAPHLGAADSKITYQIYDGLQLRYQPYLPSLTSIRIKDASKDLSGVRQHVRLTIGKDGTQEEGELQYTDTGISGIVVFNQTEHIRALMKQDSPAIYINPIPEIVEDVFVSDYQSLLENAPNRSLLAYLNGYMNDRVARHLIRSLEQEGILTNVRSIRDLDAAAISRVYHYITKQYHVEPVAISGFDKSQASSGGICTDQIDPDTMTVRNTGHRIYVTGEAMDVVGKCGGYNISFALYTGWLAGCHVCPELLTQDE